MAAANWLNVEATYSSAFLLGASEAQSYLSAHLPSFSFTAFGPQYLFWTVLWFGLYVLLDAAWKKGLFGPLSMKLPAVRRVQVIFQVLNLLASLLMLVVMIFALSPAGGLWTVLYTGSLTQEREEEEGDDDASLLLSSSSSLSLKREEGWDVPPAFVKKTMTLMILGGYAVIPLTVLYLLEIIAVSLAISLSPKRAGGRVPMSPFSAQTLKVEGGEGYRQDSRRREAISSLPPMLSSSTAKERHVMRLHHHLSPGTEKGSPTAVFLSSSSFLPPLPHSSSRPASSSSSAAGDNHALSRSLAVVSLHHIMTLLLLSVIFSPVFQCVDMLYLRLAFLMSLHIALEFPCFIAILLYRLSSNETLVSRFMAGNAVYTFLLRVSVNLLGAWCYVETAWEREKFNSWDLFWRWTFPPLYVLLVGAQLYVVKIYWILANKKKSSSDKSREREQRRGLCAASPVELQVLGPGGAEKLEDEEQQKSIVDAERGETSSKTAERGGDSSGRRRDELSLSSLFFFFPFSSRQKEETKEDSDGREKKVIEGGEETVEGRVREHQEGEDETEYLRLPYRTLMIMILFFLITLSLLFLWMPFSCEARSIAKQRIAIVGGGVSGLTAAWALSLSSPNFDITIFEREERLGGAVFTYEYQVDKARPGDGPPEDSKDEGQKIAVDLGFKTFSSQPNFEELLSQLGIESEKETELSPSGYAAFLSGSGMKENQTASSSSLSFLEERMKLREKLQEAARRYSEERLMSETVGEFLSLSGFSPSFIELHMRSCLSTYLGTAGASLSTPLSLFLFFEAQVPGCTSLDGRVISKSFRNGGKVFIERLAEEVRKNGVKIQTGRAVTSLSPSSSKSPFSKSKTSLSLSPQRGESEGAGKEEETFDHVILALRIPHLVALLEASPKSFSALNLPRRLYGRERMQVRETSAVLFSEEIDERESLLNLLLSPSFSSPPSSPSANDTAATSGHEQERKTEGENQGVGGCLSLEQINLIYPVAAGQQETEKNLTLAPPLSLSFPHHLLDGKRCYKREEVLSKLGPRYIIYGATAAIQQLTERAKERNTSALSVSTAAHLSPIAQANFSLTAHTVQFLLSARNMHKAQGVGNIWYAGAEMMLNVQEFAVLSGLVVAQALGGKYPLQEKNPKAMQGFLAAQYWMMFGVNPFVHRFTSRSTKRT